MTLFLAESFDGPNPPAASTPDKWDAVVGVPAPSITNGRLGTKGVALPQNVNDALLKVVEPASTVIFVNWWSYINDPDSSFFNTNGSMLRITDTLSTVDIRIMRGSGLTLDVRRGTALVAQSPVGVYTALAYHHVEMRIDTGTSSITGAIEVRLNGDTVINASGLNFGAATTSAKPRRIGFAGNQGQAQWIDDVIIFDTGAADTFDTFVGPIHIHALSPNGNGDRSELTGSDADSTDNYQLVDEVPFSDADYVEGTSGEADLYAFADVPTDISVLGVAHYFRSRDEGGGGVSARGLCKPTTTEFQGGDKTLTTSYYGYMQPWDHDPQAAAAWTPSTLNAAQFGIEARP